MCPLAVHSLESQSCKILLFIYSPLSTFLELDNTVFVGGTSNKILLYS